MGSTGGVVGVPATSLRHSFAAVRASDRPTVFNDPRPISRARPWKAYRKIQLRPFCVTCSQRPLPSPYIPGLSFVRLTAESLLSPRRCVGTDMPWLRYTHCCTHSILCDYGERQRPTRH